MEEWGKVSYKKRFFGVFLPFMQILDVRVLGRLSVSQLHSYL